jgi:hypothetical protein
VVWKLGLLCRVAAAKTLALKTLALKTLALSGLIERHWGLTVSKASRDHELSRLLACFNNANALQHYIYLGGLAS